jgi:hypothetical protein
MNKEEILDAFIQAEKDWSDPIETATQNVTHWGLCGYLLNQGFTAKEIDIYLEPCWLTYRTKKEGGSYHFNGFGDEPQGRKERLDAIRKVITDLKNNQLL